MLIKLAADPYVNNGRRLIRRGSMGHIYKISNLLAKSKDRSAYIHDFLNSDIDWNHFEVTLLAEQNAIDNLELGGRSNIDAFDNFSSDEGEAENVEHAHETEEINFVEVNEENLEREHISPDRDLNMDDIFQILNEISQEKPSAEVMFFENNFWKVEQEIDDLEEIN